MIRLDEKVRKQLKKAVKEGGFLRFPEKVGGVARGTVVVGRRVVPGYPKIKRVFSLEGGIRKNMGSDEFIAEEKIDGYNLRAVLHEGRLYCFSRGGHVDYFGMEKLSEIKGIGKFFVEHEGWMLCGELIGNTPHTAPTDAYDVKYYVFDVVDARGKFLGPLERRELCGKYRIECVPLVGRFRKGDVRKLKDAVKRLNGQGKEGIVMRGLGEGREIVKYVTPFSDVQDLAENSAKIFDMPLGFMKQRVFRSAVSVRELGLGRGEYEKRMGKALCSGLIDALKEGEVGEKSMVRVKELATWQSIKDGMGKEVELKDEEIKENGKLYEIRFRKVYRKGSKALKRALDGYPQED